MYIVFNKDLTEKLAEGPERKDIAAAMRSQPEGEYTLVRVVGSLRVRPPKKAPEAVIEIGGSRGPSKPRKKKAKQGELLSEGSNAAK